MVRTQMTRRQTFGLLGLAGAAYLVGGARSGRGLSLAGLPGVEEAAAQTPSCVLSPALTEGPYFVDELLNRSDIRGDRGGVELGLAVTVVRVADGVCTPYEGAVVDIWHCDRDGDYSDVSQNNTVGQKWLRGLQATDASGIARFTSIYPGWYQGRTPHIHVKVRVFNGTTETYEFNTQLFFDEAVTNAVYSQPGYSDDGTQDTTNSEDNIYAQSGGTTRVTPVSNGSGGYTAALTVGLSGLPDSGSGTTPDGTAAASITSTRFSRARDGSRRLTVKLDVDETVSADARVLRGSKLLARRRVASLEPGARSLTLRLGDGVRGGKARLRVTLEDASGNVKTARRKLRIPRPNV